MRKNSIFMFYVEYAHQGCFFAARDTRNGLLTQSRKCEKSSKISGTASDIDKDSSTLAHPQVPEVQLYPQCSAPQSHLNVPEKRITSGVSVFQHETPYLLSGRFTALSGYSTQKLAFTGFLDQLILVWKERDV